MGWNANESEWMFRANGLETTTCDCTVRGVPSSASQPPVRDARRGTLWLLSRARVADRVPTPQLRYPARSPSLPRRSRSTGVMCRR